MIRTLYAAERARLIRFGVSGLGSTALHALIAAAMFGLFDATPVIANATAFVCSTAFSYLANTLWSFSSPVAWGNFARFLAVAMAGLGVTMALAHGTETLGLARAWSIVAVVLCVPPVTFVLHRLWTYR